MRNRMFGVEIECGHPTVYYDTVRGWLTDFIPEWFNPSLWHNNLMCTVGSDGSGIEVRTPPLAGPEGFKQLRSVMKFLTEQGCYADRPDGMHVHHDAPEFVEDMNLQAALARAWKSHEKVVDQMVAERRRNLGACPKWRDSDLEAFGTERQDSYSYSRPYIQRGPRGALNLTAIPEHGTVEIRLLEGTLDADVAEAWIRFGQGFLNKVARSNNRVYQCTVPAGLDLSQQVSYLLDDLKLTKRAKATLTEKAANGGTLVTL